MEAELWAHLDVLEGSSRGPKNCRFLAHISALKMKLKTPLGASESIHMRGLLPKNEPIRPRRLGCRWGCSVFEAFHLVFRSLLLAIFYQTASYVTIRLTGR